MHKGRSPPNPFKHAALLRFTGGEVKLRIHWFLSTRVKKKILLKILCFRLPRLQNENVFVLLTRYQKCQKMFLSLFNLSQQHIFPRFRTFSEEIWTLGYDDWSDVASNHTEFSEENRVGDGAAAKRLKDERCSVGSGDVAKVWCPKIDLFNFFIKT